jgi:hypothetical protein
MRGHIVLVLLGAAGLWGQPPLRPFSLPWNDATPGITNLQTWNGGEAGANGWVSVTPEGHYALAGQRVRFLGVNVGAADAFPARDRAEGHAARLARFGINAVRFHHLEAPWDKRNVLIDYGSGNSRTLSAERLDRLHYFVDQLAKRGIYSNVNLLVSREFQPADGLGPEISRLGWKDQHILGFFSEAALALHKEHATKLLTAPNPYRNGAPLAQDPAVAFVEIMNENGLLQKWYEGVVDSLPSVYANQLQARWNQWLAARYSDTGTLLRAWGAIDEPLGPNKLRNGDFQSGTSNWNVERHTTAAAAVTVVPEFNGQPALRIQVTTPGSANWHVQLNQSQMAVEAGGVYTVSFWAKAEGPTPLSAGIQRAHTDYASLGPALNLTLGNSWTEYSLTYASGIAENNARLNFNGFGDRTATVWFANLRVQPGGRLGGLAAGQSLEASNIALVPRQGGAPTPGQTLDWVRFCLNAEKRYWDEMHQHIKWTIGYPGIVWGTIIANSPPNTQSNLDAMDSHAYWQHPTFPPGRDFNPDDWAVQNVSMVNDRTGGVLGGLARQRVRGKPHNVTEYQHPAPNTYRSEAPLLAAAYGALQDWDSLWWFDYSTGTAEFANGWFNQAGDPGKMVNHLIAAALFRRGDVAPAQNEVTVAFPQDREAELAATRGRAWSVADGSHAGVAAAWALVSRLSLELSPVDDTPTAAPPVAPGNVLASDTGELRWDVTRNNQGVVTVNTRLTKSVIGFPSERVFDLGGVVIRPGQTRQNWATISISLLTGEGFASGGTAVIVATGEQASTGMVWKDATRTSVGSRWGTAPALVEVIPASIELPVAAARVKAWALNERGERMAEVEVSDAQGKARLMLGPAATLWYEVEIAPAP